MRDYKKLGPNVLQSDHSKVISRLNSFVCKLFRRAVKLYGTREGEKRR